MIDRHISVVVENFNKENEASNLQQKSESKNTGKEISNGEYLQTFNFSLEKQLARLKELLLVIVYVNTINYSKEINAYNMMDNTLICFND